MNAIRTGFFALLLGVVTVGCSGGGPTEILTPTPVPTPTPNPAYAGRWRLAGIGTGRTDAELDADFQPCPAQIILVHGYVVSCDGSERLDTTAGTTFTELRNGESIQGSLSYPAGALNFRYTWHETIYNESPLSTLSEDGSRLSLWYNRPAVGDRYKKVWVRE